MRWSTRAGLPILAAAVGVGVVAMARHRRGDSPASTTSADVIARATAWTAADVPPERIVEHPSVAAHFEATATRFPDSVAIRTDSLTVTYAELLTMARARRPDAPPRGEAPEAALITTPMQPSTVATILGLFAGRTVVVTLDPELPARRAELIADILTAHDYKLVDTAGSVTAAAEFAGPLSADVELDDVTSIQFTSGSTGTPKAVLHTNGLWLADAQLLGDRFGLTDGRRVALCMPISFAGGLNVLIGSLVGGAEIVAVDPREYSAAQAFARIDATAAQVITCTPTFVDALHRAARGAVLRHVERLVTTGEPMQARHVKLARELAPGAVITNWVGSTETLAIASHDIAPTAPLPRGVVPVGIPAPHKRITIDADGVVSIGSRFIGPGYLDRTASAATFLDGDDGTTTYSGGDVGRWDEHGGLVFSGRADNTVKIRGYLVEPAEIEATLASYDDIREVTVVADLTGPPVLTAYAAPSTTARTPSVAELRGRLHRDLPPWMVPANIEILAALPRGDRGKVDRMALPRPCRPEFESPCSAAESTISAVWSELLLVDHVGRADNFYALGGDSLSVAQLLVTLRESHGVALSPTDLACAPTMADFAAKFAAANRVDTPSSGPQLRSTTVPLRAISADTVGAPLFCFTGAGASALCFVPLADSVGTDTAVYAFEPSGLAGSRMPDWSIERAVQRHWTDLRTIAPHGPYTLVGHSLGAYIALETARRLRDEGETVEAVVMLDPWLSPRVARAARDVVPGATVTLQTDEANGMKSWWDRQKTVPLAGFFSANYRRRTVAVEEIGMIAGYRHRPQPWDGRTLLILSHLNNDDPRLWSRILVGDLESRVLECDHHSVVRTPHIETVAESILALR